MDSDLSPRGEKRDGPEAELSAGTDAAEPPQPKASYGRVIVQLVLILPCAVLLFPAIVFSVIEVANALRSLGSGDGGLSSAVIYGVGFVCVVCAVFLPDHFAWRWLGILTAAVGLPLFINGALAMSTKLHFFGAGREGYETLVIVTGPVVVTAWNVIRLWRCREQESQ